MWLGVDQLEIVRPRRFLPLLFPMMLGIALAMVLTVASGWTRVGVGALAAVTFLYVTFRSLKLAAPKRFVLARTTGRVYLDGDPLEAARVELRAVKHWLLRKPSRYVLSLWAMSNRGDGIDIPFGNFNTLLEATVLSGQIEEFLERARHRTPGRAPTVD